MKNEEWENAKEGICRWCNQRKPVQSGYIGFNGAQFKDFCLGCYRVQEAKMPKPVFVIEIMPVAPTN